jgi:hypothetical protein
LALGLILLALTVIAAAAVVTVRFTTDWAIPGWATSAGGLLLVLFMQLLTLIAVFSFITLQNRQTATVIPIRDYAVFIDSIVAVDAVPESQAEPVRA